MSTRIGDSVVVRSLLVLGDSVRGCIDVLVLREDGVLHGEFRQARDQRMLLIYPSGIPL